MKKDVRGRRVVGRGRGGVVGRRGRVGGRVVIFIYTIKNPTKIKEILLGQNNILFQSLNPSRHHSSSLKFLGLKEIKCYSNVMFDAH